MRRMFKLASFYTAIWHRHQANHLFHANFRIALPHNVCVAFGSAELKAKVQLRPGETHEKPAVTLKMNESRELSGSSRRVRPISFTVAATMGLLMVVCQSALSQGRRVSAFLCLFTHDSQSESQQASPQIDSSQPSSGRRCTS